jgi:hypothetical protein
MYVDAHTNSRVVIFGMSPSMIKMLLRASLLAVCGTSGTHAKYPLFISWLQGAIRLQSFAITADNVCL